MAFLRRLMALGPRLGHLITQWGSNPVELSERSPLSTSTACTSPRSGSWWGARSPRVRGEAGYGRQPLRFVMLDELNKYAPREGHGPLKELFVDIAERGRSLGVLLIGCQQAAGRVAEPVGAPAGAQDRGRLRRDRGGRVPVPQP